MVNRKDFRPSNRSSSISRKDRKVIKKSKLEQGYYNVVYKNGVYLERNLNGSFTLSDDKGHKHTYYGYSQTDAKKKFNQERKFDSNFPKGHDKQSYEEKEKEKKHYDKLDKKREKTRSLLIDKPTYEKYSGEDLPIYKIDNKFYYRDLRLREYRNINNPNDKLDINIDNKRLQKPNKNDYDRINKK